MFLTLIETSGNQSFIFATNKLKENIGASELTYQITTKWLLQIVGDLNQNPALKVWQDSDLLRQNLLSSTHNPALEKANDQQLVEIIIATSGKALLLTKTEDIAQQIITRITQKALVEAPALDVAGVYVSFDWNSNIKNAIANVYREFEQGHNCLPSPNFRFLRLPIIAPCETSGLPASKAEPNPENQKVPLSSVTIAKRKTANEALTRMGNLVLKDNSKFPKNTNDLEKEFENLDWLGIVHADGNGLGQIFLNFHEFTTDNRDYINKLRKFSLALDLCTQNAFKTAIKVFDNESKQKKKHTVLPIVPLVLGGDDLTIVCDGKYALKFTQEFLLAFEKETARTDLPDVTDIISSIASHPKALQSKNLSACAGIAMVKPHFPFSVGYELAESLLKSAKTVKTNIQDIKKHTVSASALDFHIVYDSSGIDLGLIRNRLKITLDDQQLIKLYKRPLVVTPLEQLTQATDVSQTWAEFYHWHKFERKVASLSQKSDNDQEEKMLPPNQANKLRSAIFRSKEAADAEFQLVYNRYHNTKDLAEKDKSLFIATPEDGNTFTTGFLDALDAIDFI